MNITYSDQEIGALIQERKVLPDNKRSKFSKTRNRGNDEYRLNLTGEEGNKFQVIVRISVFNKLNFSVILGVKVPPPRKLFRLKRYNGALKCLFSDANLEDPYASQDALF